MTYLLRHFSERRLPRAGIMLCLALAMLLTPAVALADTSFVGASSTTGVRAAGAAAAGVETSITMSVPAGNPGDLLLCQVNFRGGTSGNVPPFAGWNLLNRSNAPSQDGQAIYYRVADGTESSAVWSYTNSGAQSRAAGNIVRYRGVNTMVPPSVTTSTSTAASVLAKAPGLTTTVDNSRVVAFFGSALDVAIGASNGMTSRYSYSASGAEPSIRAFDKVIPAAGASGDCTASVGSGYWVAHLVELKPATAVSVTAVANNKVYDGTTAATVVLTGVGVAPGDDVTIEYTSATFSDKNAGAGKTVTISGIKLGGADAGKYYPANTSATATAGIAQRAITVAALSDSKVYDGDASSLVIPTLESGTLAIGDIGTWSQSFDSAAVGTGKSLTPSGTVRDLADANMAGNYAITFSPDSTGEITARDLTVVAVDKEYDGTRAAVLTANFVSGDDAALVYTAAQFSSPSVGHNKPVSVTGPVTLSGTDSGNYALVQPSGLIADITPKTITVGGAVVAGKTYDGGSSATVDFTGASLIGVVDIEDVHIDSSLYTASFDTADVGGAKPVTVAGVALKGTDIGNYFLTQPTGLVGDITPKELAIEGALAQNKEYDGTTAATVDYTGASLSGVLGTDVVAIDVAESFAVFDSAGTGLAKPVVVTGVALSGASAGNYTVAQPEGLKADITSRSLDVLADDKTYDGNTNATLSCPDIVSGDDVALNYTAAYFGSIGVGADKPVTATTVVLSGADTGNYTVIQPVGLVADILPRGLTISGAAAQDKVYDATTSADVDCASSSLVGVVGFDAVQIDASACSADFDSRGIGTAKPVTVKGVLLSGADAGNYALTQPAGLSADVTPKNLTIDGAVAQDKPYDGTAAGTVDFEAAGLVGVAGLDLVTIDPSLYSASFDSEVAGLEKPVTVVGVSLFGEDAANYTVSQPSGLTADITAKKLSVIATDKAYDGTTAATLSTADVVTGDDVTLTYVADFDTKDVGVGKLVNVTGEVTLTGADVGNYAVTQPAGLTADITRKALTINGVVAQDKVFDGDRVANASFAGASLVGTVGADAVAIDFSACTAQFETRTAGIAIPVTVTGVVLSGGGAGNYSVGQPLGLSASITPKDLAITGASAIDRPYDGTAAASVDFSGASLVGVVGPDTVAIDSSAYAAVFATKTAGAAVPVTVTGVALSGTNADNYTVSQPSGLAADIAAKELNATAANKVYDGTTAAVLSTADVIAGDAVELNFAADFDTKDIGIAKPVTVIGDVTLTGADKGNYTVVQPAGLAANITARGLTISGVTVASRVYNGTKAATVDFSGATLSGVAGAETVGFNTTAASAEFDTKDIGTAKPVTVNGVVLTGAAAGNYTLAQPTGLTANIAAKPLTMSGVTAGNKPYDSTLAASVDLTGATLTGVLGAEIVGFNASGASAAFGTKNVGVAKPVTVTGVVLTGDDAANYVLTPPTPTANITAKGLTISGAAAQNKVYSGTTAAVVSFAGANLVGVAGADAVTINSSAYAAAFDTKNIGTAKPVTVSGVTLSGADAGNYSLAQPTGLKADITARPVTVTADNKTKGVGRPDPALTYRVTSGSLASGDTFSGALTRAAGEVLGTYPITRGTLSLSSNYAMTFQGGVLTIETPAPAMRTVWRFRSKTMFGSYLWTIDPNEMAAVKANTQGPWIYEGPAFSINTANSLNNTTMMRFRNRVDGSYLWTADAVEIANLQSALRGAWTLEGPAWKVSLAPTNTPVWRFASLKNSTHFWTMDPAEKDAIDANLKTSYKLEGISYFLGQ